MGCFLGCFGGAKENRRRKHRINRASPQRQRNRVQQEKAITEHEQQPVIETPIPIPTLTELVPELSNKLEGVEQLSPSPKKRVTFNSNITTYEHVSVHESIESLPERLINDEEKQGDLNTSNHSHSISEDDNSVTSSVGSYPPNHRYHNARESDDEGEEYGDSDLDNLDDEDEDDYSDYDDDDIDARISSQKVWTESVLTSSMESTTANPSPRGITQEVESLPYHEVGSKSNARDRSGYVNSVLNPVENITQWKAAKSKGTHLSKPPTQKENFEAEAPFSFKTKSKNANEEIAVDASLSNWLVSPPEIKKTPVRSFEDRPILGALTVEELRQMSASTASPRKSPSRSPDEMPIIGSVGTYWNHSSSTNSASSFKGIPNTTSKYKEDKRVNWHSTPFETRLDRALNRGDC